MRNTIALPNYYSSIREQPHPGNLEQIRYMPANDMQTDYLSNSGKNGLRINHAISKDINIFSSLPDYVFENEKSKMFIGALREAVEQVAANCETDHISLSKLVVSEHSDESLVIDWIFNYFRIYFSFENNGEDSYGMSESNPYLKGAFNEWYELSPTHYADVAREVVKKAIAKTRGADERLRG